MKRERGEVSPSVYTNLTFLNGAACPRTHPPTQESVGQAEAKGSKVATERRNGRVAIVTRPQAASSFATARRDGA